MRDYSFVIEGASGVSSGTFDLKILCSSDAPTTSPTKDPTSDPTVVPTANPTGSPTVEPTANPSADPTVNPTADPSVDPTVSPSTDPTVEPTLNPSRSPTTPAPTHPGELICGDHVTGDYNGVAMHVEVRMPYDGDMTLDLSGSDFEIGLMAAYDAIGNQLTDTDA